ncbi:PREDICTED: glutamate receptor ionotropic, delta-1 [Nicrophorus vespilloides]|uniref:Glutamate receptor ionotropic, delta-1 n=1 Tax=Nicrophorus vespilloides TaxID=110193 RepID=A0ABM1MR71_NICVS|nr:PREDICTED: glutamate receptor ionotropic, delta-1 [Nicrophorus vespilloides]
MGLVDLVMVGLCLNATCMDMDYMDDEANEISQARKDRFKELASELKNEHFKITTTENKPLSYTEYVNDTLVGRGSAFQFIDILMDKYGFTYEVVKPRQNSLEQDGDGVFSQLIHGEADIAAAFLPVMPAFWDFIDYSRALDEGEWVVLMKRPPESATGSGLWAPFTLDVWILILVSLLVVGPIIYFLIVLQTRLCKEDKAPIYPLPSCVWFVYGALLKQGSTLSPITDSSRLLFATWWIFITILTAFYTANLTAFLTLSKFTLPVNKVEDIGAKKYSWVTHKGSAIEESIKQIDEFRNVFLGSKSEYSDESGEEMLANWVLKRNYMYIGEKPIVEYLMYDDYMHRTDPTIAENDRCTFVITKWDVLRISRAFAFKKDFKYYELFNELIQHLVESGIIKYKLREDLPNTAICPLDLGSNERQLRNADLLMTYVIVGAGFIVSLTVFLIELAVAHFKSNELKVRTPKLQNLFTESNNNNNNNKPKRNRKAGFEFANFEDNNHVNGKLWHEMDGAVHPPPPPYHALFHPPFANSPNGIKKNINGRDYWVVKSVYGDTKLIPVRTPSALLFQHSQSNN